MMERYIKVEWPDMQKFMELKEYDDECYPDASGMIVFIPEDLYFKVMNED